MVLEGVLVLRPFRCSGTPFRSLTLPVSVTDTPVLLTLAELSSGRLHGLATSSVIHHRTGRSCHVAHAGALGVAMAGRGAGNHGQGREGAESGLCRWHMILGPLQSSSLNFVGLGRQNPKCWVILARRRKSKRLRPTARPHPDSKPQVHAPLPGPHTLPPRTTTRTDPLPTSSPRPPPPSSHVRPLRDGRPWRSALG